MEGLHPTRTQNALALFQSDQFHREEPEVDNHGDKCLGGPAAQKERGRVKDLTIPVAPVNNPKVTGNEEAQIVLASTSI